VWSERLEVSWRRKKLERIVELRSTSAGSERLEACNKLRTAAER
jgi:hypothetical protein